MQQCCFSSVYCFRHSFFTGAALEPCQLKINQFSPPILKFSTKLKDEPLNLNCSMVPCTFCLYFMQTWVDWVLIIFGTQIYPFLMTMIRLCILWQAWGLEFLRGNWQIRIYVRHKFRCNRVFCWAASRNVERLKI